MKILVIQLARFGDVYQTWPVLSALKRKHPDSEITMLVRDKFKDATYGCDSVDKVIAFNSKAILSPLFFKRNGVVDGLAELDIFFRDLQETYDWVINLSFSPISSYIVDELSRPGLKVSGYSRHPDGFLNITDDPSAYFYAQVGVGKSNRIHITDLFALVAEVELKLSDFRAPMLSTGKHFVEGLDDKSSYVVIQMGASDEKKSFGPRVWEEITQFLLNYTNETIIFTGSQEEKKSIPEALRQLKSSRLLFLHGKTKIWELFPILKNAKALISVDSVSLHISALTNTRAFNLSNSFVNFWETGPRTLGSRVLLCNSENNSFDSEGEIVSELALFLDNQLPRAEHTFVCERASGVLYTGKTAESEDFRWDIINALYLSSEFPPPISKLTLEAFQRLHELSILALEQVNQIKEKPSSVEASILSQVDDLIVQVSHLCPLVQPVVSWLRVEKLRIGPGSVEEIQNLTRLCFEKLRDISSIYTKINGRLKAATEEVKPKNLPGSQFLAGKNNLEAGG